MKLSYPLKSVNAGYPPIVVQPFGGNSAYYSRFVDANGNPEKGHMGIDFQANHGTPVLAAHDGWGFYVGPDTHGGDGVYVRTQSPETDGTYFTSIYWHLISKDDKKFGPTVKYIGRKVKAGELIGYSDNTGAPFESSGDHLHFGLAPCDVNGGFLHPGNGFGGCVDPQPYFETLSVPQNAPVEPLSPVDAVNVLAAKAEASGDQKQAGILRAIANFIKSFFGG